MDLISLIIIISIIVKIVKKNKESKQKKVVNNSQNVTQSTFSQESSWQKAARENIQKARQRAEYSKVEKQTTSNKLQGNDVARRQVHASRMDANNTTILQRAKTNAAEDRVDETLRSLEGSHGHSAHVAPAVHQHPEDIIPDNLLENIEDLMIKGYEGNLCFERDFVSEGMDMISRFSLGGSSLNVS